MRRLLLAFAALVVACSSGDDASSPGAESGPGPVAYSVGKRDVTLTLLANGQVEHLVDGWFAVGRTTGNSCTTEDVAGCTFSTCTKTDGANKGTLVDPGELTITSATFETVKMPAVDASGYTRVVKPGPIPDGEEVTISSAGTAALAKFSLTVKAAAAFTSVSFAGCTKGDASCSVTQASPVAKWTGGSKYQRVTLSTAVDAPQLHALSCVFDGSKGAGAIPAAALAKLPRGVDYTVGFQGYDEPALTAEGTSPRVALVSNRWPGAGGEAASRVTLPK